MKEPGHAPNRVPVEDEERWQTHRPRDKGHRDMGPRPVTHVVWLGIDIPETSKHSKVDTRKGQVPKPPSYKPRKEKS